MSVFLLSTWSASTIHWLDKELFYAIFTHMYHILPLLTKSLPEPTEMEVFHHPLDNISKKTLETFHNFTCLKCYHIPHWINFTQLSNGFIFV